MTTKSERGHTPTPWERDGQTVYALNDSGTNRFSANVQGGFLWQSHDRQAKNPRTTDDELEANAAFIVRAVNSHEALVKTLQNTAAALDYALGQIAETDLLRPKVAATLNAARDQLAALSLATDKETK